MIWLNCINGTYSNFSYLWLKKVVFNCHVFVLKTVSGLLGEYPCVLFTIVSTGSRQNGFVTLGFELALRNRLFLVCLGK